MKGKNYRMSSCKNYHPLPPPNKKLRRPAANFYGTKLSSTQFLKILWYFDFPFFRYDVFVKSGACLFLPKGSSIAHVQLSFLIVIKLVSIC